MNLIDFQNDETLRELVHGSINWPDPPWILAHGSHLFYEGMCSEICEGLELSSQNEFNAYGSGYASFLDAWFYREDAQFTVSETHNEWRSFAGVFVLLNSYVPYYVLGEGIKTWSGKTRSSYLPDAGMVDDFNHDCVEALSIEVEQKLSNFGLIRLSRAEVMKPISSDLEIETILNDGEQRLFDAFFHWMD